LALIHLRRSAGDVRPSNTFAGGAAKRRLTMTSASAVRMTVVDKSVCADATPIAGPMNAMVRHRSENTGREYRSATFAR
jgi:hypothetical protein